MRRLALPVSCRAAIAGQDTAPPADRLVELYNYLLNAAMLKSPYSLVYMGAYAINNTLCIYVDISISVSYLDHSG